jgi:AraC-like DNA-binding protein
MGDKKQEFFYGNETHYHYNSDAFMKPVSRITPLFGDRRHSVLWAVDVRAQEGRGTDPTLLDLPDVNIVHVIPVRSDVAWQPAEGEGIVVDEGSVLVVNTRTSPGTLRIAPGSDFIIVGMRQTALAGLYEPFRPGLVPGLRELVFGLAGPLRVASRNEAWEQVVSGFRNPVVSGPARAFWYESQFKALLALLAFNPAPEEGEFFCSRQKRLARVRVARAKSKLEARLDEAFDLHRLASEVGCSASYLSRTFSATTGMTISQYLRKRRIEKAAGMLVTGRYNVSEVAVEVGYHSLSHFSKAFQQVKGCLPSKYEAA